MKKVAILSLVAIGLVGCSSEKTHTKQSDNVSESTTSEISTASTTHSSTKKTADGSASTTSTPFSSSSERPIVTRWDTKKAQKLQIFMQNWGEKMGQKYSVYLPNQNVNFYGCMLPDDVMGVEKKYPFAVDETIVSVDWSDKGESNADYTIVAVYSDIKKGATMGMHIYFFGFHNGQPIALVSMQNQGMPDKAIHFHATENKELEIGFQQIATSD